MKKIDLKANIRKTMEEDYPDFTEEYRSGHLALVLLALKINELIDELENHKSVCH